MATAPGWYPDPDDHSTVRWWNGIGWTAWRAEDAEAPPPPHGGDPRTVATVVPTGDRERRHTLRIVALAVLTLVLVLALVAVFGAAQQRAHPRPGSATSPTVFDTPPMAPADLDYDEATRTVVVAGELVVRMPGEPASPATIEPGFGFVEAVVSFDEVHPDWISLVRVGFFDDEVLRGDPVATAAAVGELLLRDYYAPTVEPSEPVLGSFPGLPEGRSATWECDIVLTGVDVPSEVATLRVGVVALADGRQVVLVSDHDDDTDPARVARYDEFWTSPTLR